MDPQVPAGDAPEAVVANELAFKAKLAIGERAFRALRTREHLTTFTEAIGLGTAASAVASSSLVAKTFFASTGIVGSALSAIGIGAAAVTPIGWVVGAGLVAGGLYAGVSSLLEREKDTGLTIIPDYISTPLDLIGVSLAELMVPISLKMATADGDMSEAERRHIEHYYVQGWGFHTDFLRRVIDNTLPSVEQVAYARFTESLGRFTAENRDCFKPLIFQDFLLHLRELVECDGRISEAEKRELDYLTQLLNEEIRNSESSAGVVGLVVTATDTVKGAGRGVGELAGKLVGKLKKPRPKDSD